MLSEITDCLCICPIFSYLHLNSFSLLEKKDVSKIWRRLKGELFCRGTYANIDLVMTPCAVQFEERIKWVSSSRDEPSTAFWINPIMTLSSSPFSLRLDTRGLNDHLSLGRCILFPCLCLWKPLQRSSFLCPTKGVLLAWSLSSLSIYEAL